MKRDKKNPARVVTRSGRRASQKHKEITRLLDIIGESDCKSYLEIGARHGDTFYDVMTRLPKGSKGIAVDLPGAVWGINSSAIALENCIKELRHLGYDVKVIFGNSTDKVIIEDITKSGPFDAMLIDGDHRYEGVKKDWDNYSGLATKVVAFHDIAGVGVIQKSQQS